MIDLPWEGANFRRDLWKVGVQKLTHVVSK